MKSRVTFVFIGIAILITLLVGTFVVGFLAGRVLAPVTSSTTVLSGNLEQAISTPIPPKASGTPKDLEELFVPFWQAWQLVHDQYVDQPVDDEVLMRGAIDGMLQALGDPHTSYMDPEAYGRLTTQLQGEEEYEGIGAWVDISGEYLEIISPMPNLPAEKAGLRTGDKIIAVDGEDMTGLDGQLVLKRVLGPAGSSVTLTISREGVEPFDVVIVRQKITVPSIDGRILDENIAYVRILIFSEDVDKELRSTLRTLLKEDPVGLIIDLRGNGGGLLSSSVEVASEFISEGVIVYEEYGDGTRRTFEAKRGGVATDIPLIILVNEGSASASEIVAGVIQDYDRGLLVGATTFGKGSVQQPTNLKNDQGAVRITIARWLTPNGRTIHETGLTPDIEIQITEDDIAAGIDPQLDKAIEVLLGN